MEDRGDSNLPPPSAASMYAATLLPSAEYDDVEEYVAELSTATAPPRKAPAKPRLKLRPPKGGAALASISKNIAETRGSYGGKNGQ